MVLSCPSINACGWGPTALGCLYTWWHQWGLNCSLHKKTFTPLSYSWLGIIDIYAPLLFVGNSAKYPRQSNVESEKCWKWEMYINWRTSIILICRKYVRHSFVDIFRPDPPPLLLLTHNIKHPPPLLQRLPAYFANKYTPWPCYPSPFVSSSEYTPFWIKLLHYLPGWHGSLTKYH